MDNVKPRRFETIDCLRGLASLAVVWLHFTYNDEFLSSGWLKYFGSYGWLGVMVFFVISGFIIPYSLWSAEYSLSFYPKFILKRVVRLDPPYIITIALLVALAYVSTKAPGFRGGEFNITLTQVLLHLGYVNVFFGYEWLNVIFWTLAIEFQYYILIGLLFPLIGSRNKKVRLATYAALGLTTLLLPSAVYLFHWLFLFMMGMLVFQLRVGLIGRFNFWATFSLLIAGAAYTLGGLIASVGAVTAILIAFVTLKSRLLFFFGSISYSLYLLHLPIGGRIINLSLRFASTTPAKLLVLCVAVGASVLASYLLYRYVEKPSQRLSSSIRYRSAERRQGVTGSAADSGKQADAGAGVKVEATLHPSI